MTAPDLRSVAERLAHRFWSKSGVFSVAELQAGFLEGMAEALEEAGDCSPVFSNLTHPAEVARRFMDKIDSLKSSLKEKPSSQAESCHADRDGECKWRRCPQLRDGEPEKSGRHCPIDVEKNDEF